MLVSSIFSFFHNVFKRLLFKSLETQGLFGNALNIICTTNDQISVYLLHFCQPVCLVLYSLLKLVKSLFHHILTFINLSFKFTLFKKKWFNDKILDSSKLKDIADDNFKFDENSRKLSKRVENTVGKGEIARYEQFLLFPQCFHKVC